MGYKTFSRDDVADTVKRYYDGQTNGEFVDALAKARQRDYGEDYRTALHSILQVTPTDAGNSSVTPARQRLNELLADKDKTKFLAGATLDHLARQRIINISPTPTHPGEAYRRALSDVAKEYPALWRASRDGYLRDDDFTTAAMLIPNISAEVERGNFADNNQTVVKKYIFTQQ